MLRHERGEWLRLTRVLEMAKGGIIDLAQCHIEGDLVDVSLSTPQDTVHGIFAALRG